MVHQHLLWLSMEKPKLVLCFTTYCQTVSVKDEDFIAILCTKKIINIGLDL